MKLQKYFNHIAFDHAPELINQYFLDSDLKLFKLYVHSILVEYICNAKGP